MAVAAGMETGRVERTEADTEMASSFVDSCIADRA